MPQRNIKLTIAYDGSNYHGWQRQADGISTVQQTLELALAHVVNHPVALRGAGRTDTAVHAAGQVANFFTDSPIPDHRLHHAINTRLPHDIRVRCAHDMPADFDAITSAQSKLYRYTVFNHEDIPPWIHKYCYHYWRDCDLTAMCRAGAHLVGRHDFTSFTAAGSTRQSHVRTLLRCDVTRHYHYLYFDLEADGFLYHMVRNIVGALLEVGRGRWQPEHIKDILAARDRAAAGPMAPPNGLSMQWVRYSINLGDKNVKESPLVT